MGSKLSPEEKARRADERKNAWKVGFAERVRKELETWPPPTEEQLRVIHNNLYGMSPMHVARRGPSEYELEQRRKMQEREDALKAARQAALALTACDVCNLQPEAHSIRRAQHIDMHDWVPGRADKIMKGQKNG